MSRVDVFVPCYNYGRFLRECVGSVLSQEGVDVRVLILDDASSDDSPEVGRALAAEDPRVEYRRHAVNRGHIATYNEGIDWVGGDYCLLLSADDVLTHGSLARAADVMEQHPEVVLCYGRAIATADPRPDSFAAPARLTWQVYEGHRFVEMTARAWNNIVPTPTAVGRTEVQKRIGGYNPRLTHTGDMDMWLRFAACGSVAALDAEQAYYRLHGTNMSTGYFGPNEFTQLREAFDSFFDDQGRHLTDLPRIRQIAHRGLAVQAFYLANDLFNAGDTAACEEFLRLAVERWPGVRNHRGWRRLRLKRLLGCRCWKILRSLSRFRQGAASGKAIL
jgi:glycosyltransferase involved in cell wall biosynthesis